MKLAIMQPYLFPYIGYWQLINAVDKFVVLDDVNYIKKGWINRNRILLDDKDHLFTLPLKNASQNRLIKDIELDDITNWKNKFIKTLEMAYKKAPEFNTAINLIEDCLDFGRRNLSEFITNSIKRICGYLDIKTEIVESSSIYNVENIKGESKIISICKKESASEYINPIGGQNLYSKKSFVIEGIDLSFLKPNDYIYFQFKNEFLSNLSIIDALMFNNADSLKKNMCSYTLI